MIYSDGNNKNYTIFLKLTFKVWGYQLWCQLNLIEPYIWNHIYVPNLKNILQISQIGSLWNLAGNPLYSTVYRQSVTQYLHSCATGSSSTATQQIGCFSSTHPQACAWQLCLDHQTFHISLYTSTFSYQSDDVRDWGVKKQWLLHNWTYCCYLFTY